MRTPKNYVPADDRVVVNSVAAVNGIGVNDGGVTPNAGYIIDTNWVPDGDTALAGPDT